MTSYLEQRMAEVVRSLRGDDFTDDYYQQAAGPFVAAAEWHASVQFRAAWQEIDKRWASDPSFCVADCLRLLADRW